MTGRNRGDRVSRTWIEVGRRAKSHVNDMCGRRQALETAGSGRRLAELLALSAFAIAQPLYVRLATQTPFLLDTGTTPVRLLALTAAIYLGPPLVLWMWELLAGRGRPQLVQKLHAVDVGVLIALFCLQVGRRWTSSTIFIRFGLTGYLVVLGALLAAMGGTLALRQRRIRQALWLAACGSLLFPFQFLRSGAAATILTPPERAPQATVGRPAPVIVMIFDEFCGMSLLNEEHQIDAGRYPNFARLAATSTWYRNASTVHARTNFAVPALLTGRRPLGEREMTLAEAPQNLFTLLQAAGYTTAAFEPVSRLYPTGLHTLQTSITARDWAAMMGKCLASVYVCAVVPTELPLPLPLPEIPEVWYGLMEEIQSKDLRAQRTGVFRDASDANEQFAHFVDCLPHSSRPGLCVLHAMLPHCPWRYLPSGENYLDIETLTEIPVAGVGSLSEDWVQDELPVKQTWQRYLLQVGDLDRRLGIVIDQLESSGVFDDALIVVAGDHGVSFLAGHSRRMPDGENLPDILSVPLFIKRPGQHVGVVSDRNVESIDVLPTIAAALQLDLPRPVDGESLLDDTIPERARKTIEFDGGGSTVVTADFPQRYRSLDRMLAA
ncbi:MAG: sulfatase-like hydrolase/transferase, partial [Planctomycetaceae bacterium]